MAILIKTAVPVWFALFVLSTTTAAWACQPREPTMSTGPGPHDYSFSVDSHELWREGDAGEPLLLRARVLDSCGAPVAGARIKILHANHEGYHEAQRWRANLTSDERGAFKIITVFPGFTGGIARHIHFIISHPEHQPLVTRLFFKNDPDLEHGVEQLAMVLEEISRDGRTGWLADYEFVQNPN